MTIRQSAINKLPLRQGERRVVWLTAQQIAELTATGELVDGIYNGKKVLELKPKGAK